MAEMLSPGVFITEIDTSAIVPTVSNSVGVFGGDFVKGPVDTFILCNNTDDLISYYGKPTNSNYNQWYQAYNFLQYGSNLLISRASNVTGYSVEIDGCTYESGTSTVVVSSTNNLNIGQIISIGDSFYEIVSINSLNHSIVLDRELDATGLTAGDAVSAWFQTTNGVIEVTDSVNTTSTDVGTASYDVPNDEVQNEYDYVKTLIPVLNFSDFEQKQDSISFASADSKFKFIARNPGAWANNISICVATPDSFSANSSTPTSYVTKYAFEGISVDSLFEYAPTGDEIGIIIKDGDTIVEIFKVDYKNVSAKDYNNKSTYIETVINNSSSYVYVKVNEANVNDVADYTLVYDSADSVYVGKTLTFKYAIDTEVQTADLLNAYDIFGNKEDIDIDIVIGNEFDAGVSAKNLAETRQDCIAFIGANYGDLVGQKSAIATSNLVAWRKTGDVNYNNMFVVVAGNYKYQYDRYNDKNRWINIAGDIAGLRAQTNTNRATWFASAGLERGQIKNVIKLAFNPTQGQRDLLYKNSINPICSFPGQGTVMWGQKTLLDKASSFDRVNVRGLFNTLERALGKMAKYQVMEFNDNFTRNRISSMIKPYLSTVQAGRGIQDFLVICDETNNTADIISRNQLVVDIFIKPTYVAEFIQLRFTNAGTNSFAEVIGG